MENAHDGKIYLNLCPCCYISLLTPVLLVDSDAGNREERKAAARKTYTPRVFIQRSLSGMCMLQCVMF